MMTTNETDQCLSKTLGYIETKSSAVPMPVSKAVTGLGIWCLAVIGTMGWACTTKSTTPVDTPVLCATIDPIEWSDKDTSETKKQVIAHNKVWDHFCNKKK